jgi:hypothetical protein
MIWMERSQKIMWFKKKTKLKTDFGCESYALFKKCINDNQGTTWWCKLCKKFFKKSNKKRDLNSTPLNNTTFNQMV